MKKIYIPALLFMLSLLVFAGCSRTAEQPDTLAVTAAFEREDKSPLSGDTVRLSHGGDSSDYQLDAEGTLRASGLPRSGEMQLTLLDQREDVQGAMTLSFDQGGGHGCRHRSGRRGAYHRSQRCGRGVAGLYSG